MLLTPSCLKAHARAECTVYRYGSEYDVIHTYSREEKDKEKPYSVHLIVYERPQKSAEWKRLYSLEGNADIASGLERLLEQMRVGLKLTLDKPEGKPGTSDKNDGDENATKGQPDERCRFLSPRGEETS